MVGSKTGHRYSLKTMQFNATNADVFSEWLNDLHPEKYTLTLCNCVFYLGGDPSQCNWSARWRRYLSRMLYMAAGTPRRLPCGCRRIARAWTVTNSFPWHKMPRFWTKTSKQRKLVVFFASSAIWWVCVQQSRLPSYLLSVGRTTILFAVICHLVCSVRASNLGSFESEFVCSLLPAETGRGRSSDDVSLKQQMIPIVLLRVVVYIAAHVRGR